MTQVQLLRVAYAVRCSMDCISIAETFFRSGEIEAWGQGYRKIFEACREAGMPEPLVEAVGGAMSLTFFFGDAYLSAVQSAEKSRESSDRGSDSPDRPEKWGEKSTATRIRIARIIAENPGVSVREIAIALGINTSAVERHMAAMRKVGALERVGSPKGGYWRLTE